MTKKIEELILMWLAETCNHIYCTCTKHPSPQPIHSRSGSAEMPP